MNHSPEKILIIEDEKNSALAYKEILENYGYTAECVFSAEEGLQKIEEDDNFFLVLTDMKLGGMSGFELIEKTKKIRVNLQYIVITAYGTITSAVDAMKLGIIDYFTKPVDFEKLKIAVAGGYEKYRLIKENIYLKSKLGKKYAFDNIIGASGKMRKVFELIEKVAASNATVLLRGESGTGKGLIARAIHFNSGRKDAPLIELNCAALPDTLLESELFGHIKGAFTGALADRTGRFEEANDGTIFLDEIGEIGLNVQAKLLRVLQDKIFERLGSNKPIKMNARVIASTNRNLEQAMEENLFRKDLYYRLNVVPLYIPSLRERLEDIPALVNFFIKKYCAAEKVELKKIEDAAVERLMNYSWPGNIRELENLIERAIVIVDGNLITEKDILSLKKCLSRDIQSVNTGKLEPLISDYERKIIEKTLESVNNNRAKAAELLGVSLRQLQYKLQKYGSSQ